MSLIALLACLASVVAAQSPTEPPRLSWPSPCLAASTFAGMSAPLPNAPRGITVDAAGVVYVADDSGRQVLRVYSDGRVEQWLGHSNFRGEADGIGTTAYFTGPYDVELGPDGVVFILDMFSSKLRQATPSGLVRTLAGNYAGFVDGNASVARFAGPVACAYDAKRGLLYISDRGNHAVRAYNISSGAVFTVAGNGTARSEDGRGTGAQFNDPSGIAYDASRDMIYVAEQSGFRLRSISPSTGEVATLAGSDREGKEDGVGTAASFSFPGHVGAGVEARFSALRGIAFDAMDNLLIADEGNNRIRLVSPLGVVRTLAGSGVAGDADGPASSARFNSPLGIAVCRVGILVTDALNNKVRLIISSSQTTTVATFAGNGNFGNSDGPATSATFADPSAVTCSGDAVFLLEFPGKQVRRIQDGAVSTLPVKAPTGSDYTFDFSFSSGIVVDSAGNIIISDYLRVIAIAPNGTTATTVAGSRELGKGQRDVDGWVKDGVTRFGYGVQGLALAPNGDLFMAELDLGAIRVLNTTGFLSTFLRSASRFGHADGLQAVMTIQSVAAIQQPVSVAINSHGDVYFSDRASGRIVRVGALDGPACDGLYVSSGPCRKGTVVDWAARTCRPCPPGASASGYAYSSYCVDEAGKVMSNADSSPSVLLAPLSGGAIAAAIIAPAIALAVLLALASYFRCRHRAKLTVQQSTMGSEGFSAIVSPLGELAQERKSRGAASEPLDATAAIAWSELAPDLAAVPLFGGFGVILRATWRGSKQVAVKVPLIAIRYGSLPAAASALLVKEAKGLVLAQNRGANDFVVKLHGVAQGVMLDPRWDALLLRARELLLAKDMRQPAEDVLARPLELPQAASRRHAEGLVMSWEAGGSLHDALFPKVVKPLWPERPLDRLRVCTEIATGLWHLHDAGLVHGDLKLENVLLSAHPGSDSAPHARLADFGLADSRASAAVAGSASRLSTMQHTHERHGTTNYMAPEMFSEGNGAGGVAAALSSSSSSSGGGSSSVSGGAGVSTADPVELHSGLSRGSRVTVLGSGSGVASSEDAAVASSGSGGGTRSDSASAGSSGGARAATATAAAASRTTDIFALGTLMWEVLSQQQAWKGFDEAARLSALRTGRSLDLAILHLATPPAVRELVARCLAFDRAQRPRTHEVRSTLERELRVAQSGPFDVFLSHCWGADKCRKPLTDAIYSALRADGFTVWLDSNNMRGDLQASMREGISSSSVVVVLVSPDYARSKNCMFELKAAHDTGKPIVTCIVEPGFWTTWALRDVSRAVPDNHELVALASLNAHLFVDLGKASRVNWQHEPVSFDERRLLTHEAEALPRLVTLIKEAQLALGLGGANAGGGKNAASVSAAPAAPSSAMASADRATVALTKGTAGVIADAASVLKKTASWRG